jgi:hypothetical protein
MTRFIFCTCFALCTLTVFAQEVNKPQIGSIAGIPADAIPSGRCAASRAGYFETTGKDKMTEAKLAKFVSSSLRDGYVLTIYPETKNGIFVNMECTAQQPSTASRYPAHP